MRIVHLDTGREMRGGQWQALLLHQGLLEGGIDSLLLCPAASPLAGKAKAERLPVVPLRALGGWPSADLYHAHDARAHTLAAMRSVNSLIVSRRVAFPLRQSLTSRWKYRRGRRFLAISRFVQTVLEQGGVHAGRIRVVYDGVLLPAVKASGSTIVAPASADSMKGSDLLRQAAALAGMTIQFSDDLHRDLPHAGLMVYLSRSEGLGSAALLASAYAVPVLASNIEGLTESVLDGETGMLVENDPPAIAAELKRLMADSHLRQRLGIAGRRRVEQQFSVNRMVSETLRNYREVLA